MPDIKKFIGFVAPDGSAHNSLKAATEYVRDLKIKAALNELALNFNAHQSGVALDSEGNPSIRDTGLSDYLFANKAAITAAYNPEVTTRKKRTPSVPGAVKVKKAKLLLPVIAVAAEGDSSDGVSAHPGVLNLDADE